MEPRNRARKEYFKLLVVSGAMAIAMKLGLHERQREIASHYLSKTATYMLMKICPVFISFENVSNANMSMDDLTYTINYCPQCSDVMDESGYCYCEMYGYPYEDIDWEIPEYVEEICLICRQTLDFCLCHRYDEEHFYEDMNG